MLSDGIYLSVYYDFMMTIIIVIFCEQVFFKHFTVYYSATPIRFLSSQNLNRLPSGSAAESSLPRLDKDFFQKACNLLANADLDR